MNTRLQVEHPVTELVTRIDLVKEQLRIAANERLTFAQEDVRAEGASIECRIVAEDPARGFLPSIGRITRLEFPAGPGVRVDAGIYEGYEVPVHYDSLLAKLITWGADRAEAIARMERALDEFVVDGVRTNISFHRWLVRDAAFRKGDLSTDFLTQRFDPSYLVPDTAMNLPAIVAAAVHAFESARTPLVTGDAPARASAWKLAGRTQGHRGRR
jgi:acetyl-CoA carboxylase biotin carboxylase subunit